MRLLPAAGCLAVVCYCLAAPARGQQQVTLQSGTTLVGNASLDGPNMVVDVEGAKIAIPFKEVASVTAITESKAQQAEHLLVQGLETQILSDGEQKDLSRLAAAYRLTPEDPQVAFWYAYGLLDSGYGKAANDVFEPHRKAITAAYPGIADRLAGQIEGRVKLESLPAPLLKRLDEIEAASQRVGAVPAESVQYAAYFRLLDQSDEPVEESAFRVSGSGENQNLESFADGYYLFTVNRRNGFGDFPCRLEFVKPELVGDNISFRGGTHGAENVGVIRVKKLSDAERQSVDVHVVDREGKPLASAAIHFHAIRANGSQVGAPPVTTLADGTAKLRLFPGDYTYQVTLPGYAPLSEKLVVPAQQKQAVALDVKLFRAISAAIKVKWQSKPMLQPGMPQVRNDAVTSGEFELQIGPDSPNGMAPGPFAPRWVRLVQVDESVQLQFINEMNFPQPVNSWVGRWKYAADEANQHGENPEDDAEVFDMLDLGQLNSIKEQLQLETTILNGPQPRGGPVSLPLEAGDIYLGKLSSHDPQMGRPASVEFKILATKLKQP